MAKTKTIKDAKVSETNKENIDELEVEKTEKIETKEKIDIKENKHEKKKANKKEGYLTKVRKELKKVVWPKAGEIAKYTLAVLIFCITLCLFFKAMELLAALLKELFV